MLAQDDAALIYETLLARPPSAAELADLRNRYPTQRELSEALMRSQEFMRRTRRIQDSFLDGMPQAVLHMMMPGGVDEIVSAQLLSAASLRPAEPATQDDFAVLSRRPLAEKRRIRYAYGDISHGFGTALEKRHSYLAVLSAPQERLLRFFEGPGRAAGAKDLGSFLREGAAAPQWRLTLDNPLMRRLGGEATATGLGQEEALLRRALSHALSDTVILGFDDQLDHLWEACASQGFWPEGGAPAVPDLSPLALETPASDALKRLTEDERALFESFISWDAYLYAVCRALCVPPSPNSSVENEAS